MDTNISRYWTINIIANPFDKDGKATSCYREKQSTLAKEFFEQDLRNWHIAIASRQYFSTIKTHL